MKTENFKNGGCYVNPACHILEVTAEGLLCISGIDKEYNTTLDGYVQKDETYW